MWELGRTTIGMDMRMLARVLLERDGLWVESVATRGIMDMLASVLARA